MDTPLPKLTEECVVTHPSTFVKNKDGSYSFEARVIIRLNDGTHTWAVDRVIQFRARKESDPDPT